jgi:hypothetical protein
MALATPWPKEMSNRGKEKSQPGGWLMVVVSGCGEKIWRHGLDCRIDRLFEGLGERLADGLEKSPRIFRSWGGG